jgi:hypothetical protein
VQLTAMTTRAVNPLDPHSLLPGRCTRGLLGLRILSIDRYYLLPIVALVVVLSLIPVLLKLRRGRSTTRT